MPKITLSAPTTPAGVALRECVEQIRRWYQIGRESLKNRPGSAPPGSGVFEDEARRLGIGVGALRKLRQFADPKCGYTPKMLDSLCDQCLRANRCWALHSS